MAKPSLTIKKRLLFLLIIFTILVIALLSRLAYIQIGRVVNGHDLLKEAFAQQNSDRLISPERGAIYDRNGKVLAVNGAVETITADPEDIQKSKKSSEYIAEKLAEILNVKKEDVLQKITRKKSRYEVIKAKVDKEIGDRIKKWIKEENIKGIYIYEDTKRYYPSGNLAAHVIGFTGAENQGLQGIEKTMDKYLKGLPGRILNEVDIAGRQLPFEAEKRIEAQNGLNVVLTIDETIQYFTEKALERAIEDYKVAGGAAAIVMDPRNGDILAMVSKPDFDLNNPFAAPPVSGVNPDKWSGTTQEDVDILSKTVWRNKAVEDAYEPGSPFKIITSAAGLEEGLISPDTVVYDYPVEVAGHTITCWRESGNHGEETFKEGVYNSCNPVFVRLAQSLGINRFYSYVRAFGFYEKTGIELPGETVGLNHPKPTEIDMAVASFGQRFTVTPIQMITAYSAIANGGKLIKPKLVKELTDSEGNIVKKFETEVVRNVISKQTSDTLREILEGVVSEGTGRNAYVKGYRVGGKTGTSETTQEDVYVASFAAIAPADNPVITLLVVLFDPKGETHMGGAVAAPVAGKLIEDILNYLEVERRYTERDKQLMVQEVYVPEVKGMTVEEAVKKLREFKLEYKIEGDENNKNAVVMQQAPGPGTSIPEKSLVILYTYKPEAEVTVKMPYVINKTIDEATQALNAVGLNIKVNGMGVAVQQAVEPGTPVPKGKVIEVQFSHVDEAE